MKRIILFIFIIAPFWGFAQNDAPLKSWAEGTLTWEDFKGKTPGKGVKSHLATELNAAPLEKTKSSKEYTKIITTANINRYHSYADDADKTEQRLRYHQLQFDQLEIFRRRLQVDINLTYSADETEGRVQYFRTLYKEQLEQIDKDTDFGTNDQKLQEWEYYTRKGLEEIISPPSPEVKTNDFSYGIILGVGGLFSTGGISDNFSDAFIFKGGLTGGWRNIMISTDVAYGQPSINNHNIFNIVDATGRELQGNMNSTANYLGVSINAGYTVFSSKLLSITPNVGCYWSNYQWTSANFEWVPELNEDGVEEDVRKIKDTEKSSLRDFNWKAGIDFDIHLHKYVSPNSSALKRNREKFVSSIRISPFVARAEFTKANPVARGYQFGVTVSYLGLVQSLSVK